MPQVTYVMIVKPVLASSHSRRYMCGSIMNIGVLARIKYDSLLHVMTSDTWQTWLSCRCIRCHEMVIITGITMHPEQLFVEIIWALNHADCNRLCYTPCIVNMITGVQESSIITVGSLSRFGMSISSTSEWSEDGVTSLEILPQQGLPHGVCLLVLVVSVRQVMEQCNALKQNSETKNRTNLWW